MLAGLAKPDDSLQHYETNIYVLAMGNKMLGLSGAGRSHIRWTAQRRYHQSRGS